MLKHLEVLDSTDRTKDGEKHVKRSNCKNKKRSIFKLRLKGLNHVRAEVYHL